MNNFFNLSHHPLCLMDLSFIALVIENALMPNLVTCYCNWQYIRLSRGAVRHILSQDNSWHLLIQVGCQCLFQFTSSNSSHSSWLEKRVSTKNTQVPIRTRCGGWSQTFTLIFSTTFVRYWSLTLDGATNWVTIINWILHFLFHGPIKEKNSIIHKLY
jgi:hypothetical protein